MSDTPNPAHGQTCRCEACFGACLSSVGSGFGTFNNQQDRGPGRLVQHSKQAQIDQVNEIAPACPTHGGVLTLYLVGKRDLQGLMNAPQIPLGGSIWADDPSTFREGIRQGERTIAELIVSSARLVNVRANTGFVYLPYRFADR